MNKHKGFTLVELMIVMAIVGIFSAVAAPYMRTYISNSSSNSLSSTLLIDIMYARNHAITNNKVVTMRPLDATLGTGVLVLPGTGVNWGLGWEILEAGNIAPIRQHVSFGPDAHIRSIDATNVLDRSRPIVFNASGIAVNIGTLSIGVVGCAGDNARTIQINQIGQVIGNDIACPITFTNN